MAAIDQIIHERNENGLFKDFPDFISRCAHLLNKRMIEGLIYAGAFDSMDVKRSQLIAVYENLYARASAINKQKNSSQMSLFGSIIEEEKLTVNYPDIPEYELNEKLAKEKEVLGVYVSGHPFEKYVDKFADCNFNCGLMDDYTEDEDGEKTYNSVSDGMEISMGGIITNVKKTVTKRTGAYMAFVTVEDVYGSIECLAFPKFYEKFKDVLINDKIVRLSGKLDLDNGKEPTVILDGVAEFAAEEKAEEQPKEREALKNILWLNATELTDGDFDELVDMLNNYPGETQCAIKRGQKKYKLEGGVNYCKGLLAELMTFLNESDVVLV
ncbi:MAG: OB-fold nucleic acid binding domain-containing protein [Clostridia bacterium]|nr:OB-fold nucleic acid binding domain-containing protein [Clostridia bacterium]